MKKYYWNILARKNSGETKFWTNLFLTKNELKEQVKGLQLAGFISIAPYRLNK